MLAADPHLERSMTTDEGKEKNSPYRKLHNEKKVNIVKLLLVSSP